MFCLASLVGPAPPTQLILSPSDIVAVEGQHVELECASNAGAGSVTWEPLPPSASILQPSGFLRFSSVTAENNGVYSCSVGGSTASATLTVQGVWAVCVGGASVGGSSKWLDMHAHVQVQNSCMKEC